MVNLNMPDGLTDGERVQWLRNTCAALAEETGHPAGQIIHYPGDGQPSWIMWWPDDEPGEHRPQP